MTSSGQEHTYGPSCLLQIDSNAFTRRASELSMLPPPLRAHFFYSSALPIDDPLSPVPPPSSSTHTGPSKVPPRPFSLVDNTALEEAWRVIHKPKQAPQLSKESPSWQSTPSEGKHDLGGGAISVVKTDVGNEGSRKIGINIVERDGTSACSIKTVGTHIDKDLTGFGNPHPAFSDDAGPLPFNQTKPVDSAEILNDEVESGIAKMKHRRSSHRRDRFGKTKPADDTTTPIRNLPAAKATGPGANYAGSPSQRDTTGTPFLRAPSRPRKSRSQSPKPSSQESDDSPSEDDGARSSGGRHPTPPFSFNRSESLPHSDEETKACDRSSDCKSNSQKAYITVGISRLHVVELPDFRMGPIYWDPIHDVCSVARGTWFYKDTMMPVESNVANQIEEGYEYLKPWTTTYADELNSCLEIGAEAEMKIVYRVWPVAEPSCDVRPSTAQGRVSSLKPLACKGEPGYQFINLPAIQNSENKAAGFLDGRDDPVRLYEKCSLIYANARDAQILRPSQLPSVARGRRPLAAIRKGRSVGIPVVRGYDYRAWDKIHTRSKRAVAHLSPADSISKLRTGSNMPERGNQCDACAAEEERPKATDLVLVIHGQVRLVSSCNYVLTVSISIGQKLSERVESFHFTHAINAFRRQVNMELEVEEVRPWLRRDFGGIMVLPINWRSTLKLEDGGPDPYPNRKDYPSSRNQFTLKDITAESIPAVRNLISDVMLDIPYYLSHHKKKMVEAVVKEANRVYRQWCRNNPDFHDSGRVHLIAHSLGSVMALDILSKQPTKLPPELNFMSKTIRDDIFEFDTKSLFFCGSPAGFFLLLNRSPLIPRRGRDKPGADGEDLSTSLAGEANTYGCLAVDNLYNVMHYNDPIAYRLNACVDVDYAASLQPASVPSTANTWFQSIGSIFRTATYTIASKQKQPTSSEFAAAAERPSIIKLPSTLEMETHDFSREEIAEKRMLLLNDNGQIDYTLHSGGGPLEIQYLNMLSAHSSYWTLQDFIRFLVVEIGRKGGKEETVASMTAKKKVRGNR